MHASAIQTLSPAQIELLVMLTFEHAPQTQKAMLPLLGPDWRREQLQLECGRLVELGWLKQTSGRWGVAPEFQERVARYAWRNGLIPEVTAARLTTRDLSGVGLESRRRICANLRKALYTGDSESFASSAVLVSRCEFTIHPLAELWQPFDPDWLEWLAPPIRLHLLNYRMLSEEPLTPEERSYLEAAVLKHPEVYDQKSVVQLALESLLAGRVEIGESLASQVDHPAALACLAFAHMQRGQADLAVKQYHKARADLRKLTGRRNVGFGGEYGWLEILALIETGNLVEAQKWLAHGPKLPVLRQILELAQGHDQSSKLPDWTSLQGLEGLLCALLYSWCDTSHPGWEKEARRLEQQGRHWLAEQYRALLGKTPHSGMRSLLAVLERKPVWKLALEAMEKLAPAPKTRPAPTHNLRLIWLVEVYTEGSQLGIEPVEQKLSKQGWTSGRPVALKRLVKDYPVMEHLTPADRDICRAIRTVRTGYYGQVDISLDPSAAAPYLVDHPLVFRRSTSTPLRVQSVRGKLKMTQRKKGTWVTFELPKAYTIRGQCLEILQINACERGLMGILGQGLLVPAAGQEQLARVLESLSDEIVSDLPGDPDFDLRQQLQKALGGS